MNLVLKNSTASYSNFQTKFDIPQSAPIFPLVYTYISGVNVFSSKRGPHACVCVECSVFKKPILFKVTEPSSVPHRAPPACAKMAAYPEPPPVIPSPPSRIHRCPGHTVCFFVLCNRHWFNKAPGPDLRGTELEVTYLPFTLAQTLAMPIYPYPYWVPQSASGLW